MNRVISFASGKGGVGKTTLTANVGIVLAAHGHRTLLIDGDWTLGKLGILFGVRPRWTVEKALSGEIPLGESIAPVRENLGLLASPTGVVGLEELTEAARQQLFFEIESLRDRFDYLLLDHSSGVHWGVLPFAAAAHEHVIVTSPEPTSFADAYAIMKILSKRFAVRDFALVVTMSTVPAETERIIGKFLEHTRTQLDVRVERLETFAWEPRVAASIRRQKPIVEQNPSCEFSLRLMNLAQKLVSRDKSVSHGLNFFYDGELPNLEAR